MRTFSASVETGVDYSFDYDEADPPIGDDGSPLTKEQAIEMAAKHALYEAKMRALNEAAEVLLSIIIGEGYMDDSFDPSFAPESDEDRMIFRFAITVAKPGEANEQFNEGLEAAKRALRLDTKGVSVLDIQDATERVDALKK